MSELNRSTAAARSRGMKWMLASVALAVSATVDASAIAQAHRLGNRTRPIVNTAILGAFAGVTGLVSIESVVKAITEGAPVRPSENVAAAREAFGRFQVVACEEVES